MKLFIFIIWVLPLSAAFGQQFRIDYNYFCVYEMGEAEEAAWKDGYNTFVMNINDNNDMMMYKASGKQEVFRKLTVIEEGQTDDGEHYQYFLALDGEGIRVTVQVFDNGEIGLRLIYQNITFQFAN